MNKNNFEKKETNKFKDILIKENYIIHEDINKK